MVVYSMGTYYYYVMLYYVGRLDYVFSFQTLPCLENSVLLKTITHIFRIYCLRGGY